MKTGRELSLELKSCFALLIYFRMEDFKENLHVKGKMFMKKKRS